MKAKATGTFEVKMNPQPWSGTGGETADPTLNRFLLDKQYHGDLEAAADAQMLSSGTADGSGAYVAIEKVLGTLHGRAGGFVLQHAGVMNRRVPTLSITVVPDSGSGELTGLSGELTITIAEGKHSYHFDYTLGTLQ